MNRNTAIRWLTAALAVPVLTGCIAYPGYPPGRYGGHVYGNYNYYDGYSAPSLYYYGRLFDPYTYIYPYNSYAYYDYNYYGHPNRNYYYPGYYNGPYDHYNQHDRDRDRDRDRWNNNQRDRAPVVSTPHGIFSNSGFGLSRIDRNQKKPPNNQSGQVYRRPPPQPQPTPQTHPGGRSPAPVLSTNHGNYSTGGFGLSRTDRTKTNRAPSKPLRVNAAQNSTQRSQPAGNRSANGGTQKPQSRIEALMQAVDRHDQAGNGKRRTD